MMLPFFTVSAVLALTPLATLGFSVLAACLVPLHAAPEHLSPESWVGAGIVVAGSLLTALGRRRAEAAAEPRSGECG